MKNFPVRGPWSWVVWGQKMCSDFKSPMLQVLSNTSLKVFFSTTPNFCLGVYGPPPPSPLSFAAYAIVLLLLRKSETLLFGILLGCLHYYRCRHCKIWRNFGCPPLLNPTFFLLIPLLNKYFFMVPHQIPPATAPPPDNTWTVSNKVFLAYSLLHIWNKTLVAFITIDIINN